MCFFFFSLIFLSLNNSLGFDRGEEKSLEPVETAQQEAVNKYVLESLQRKQCLGSEISPGFLLYCDRRSGRLARYDKFGETGVSEYAAEARGVALAIHQFSSDTAVSP